MESLRDITLIAAGIALAVIVFELGLWIGARRAERAVARAQNEEPAGVAERHSDGWDRSLDGPG